jgi:hypothetical protein
MVVGVTNQGLKNLLHLKVEKQKEILLELTCLLTNMSCNGYK